MEAALPGQATQRGLTSLILPTYNPGAAILETWSAVREFVEHAAGFWEVLFVCDGCTDGTQQQLLELTADSERLRVIDVPRNRGKGHAVRAGLEQACGEWRIFTDVDLSYGLDGVLRVAQKLWRGADMVFGSRQLAQSSYIVPAQLQDYAYKRRLQSVVFSTVAQWLLALPYTDTQAGLKGCSATAWQRIAPYLECDGFAFDCEWYLICQHLRLPIEQVPVHFVYKDGLSTTTLRKSLRMLHELWRLRRLHLKWQHGGEHAVHSTPSAKPAVADREKRAA